MNYVPGAALPLTGGRIAGQVLRRDDTVLRSMSRSSAFMASVLQLLERQGFAGAPRYLGREEDFDVLTYLEGEVQARFRPWSDEQVRAAAGLLRAMHDATRGSDLAGRFDVVCHHDPGPNNAVFRNDVPVAFIDFEHAAPGSRLEDVAYMAWTWSVSSKQIIAVGQQAQQVRLIAEAYGLEPAERHVLVDCVLERQSRNVRFWAEFLAHPHQAPATAQVLAERIAWSRQEHNFVHAHRDVFDQALR